MRRFEQLDKCENQPFLANGIWLLSKRLEVDQILKTDFDTWI